MKYNFDRQRRTTSMPNGVLSYFMRCITKVSHPEIMGGKDNKSRTFCNLVGVNQLSFKGAPDKPCGEDARMLTQNCR